MRTILIMILFMFTCVVGTFAIVYSVEVYQVMNTGECIPYEVAMDLIKSYGMTVVGSVLYQVMQKD